MSDRARVIAAIGSSFAAGPGIRPVVNAAALRSGANYAHLLADRLGAHLVDLTVSGATTSTVLDHPQRVRLKRFAPQIEGVPPDADIVTITAGGNDLNFLGAMHSAVLANRRDRHALTRPRGRLVARSAVPASSPADCAAVVAGLSRIATATMDRAPNARVVLVDYVTILAPYTEPGPQIPLTHIDIAVFIAVQAALQQAFIDAAAHAGVELLQSSVLSADHGLGSAEPWVFPYRGKRHQKSLFHPNARGMQAIADELVARHDNG